MELVYYISVFNRAILRFKIRNVISKSFEYKIRSTVRKKVQIFMDIELPLLVKNGLFPLTSQFSSACGNSHGEEQYLIGQNDILPAMNTGLGKAKVPGPNPGQGSFL